MLRSFALLQTSPPWKTWNSLQQSQHGILRHVPSLLLLYATAMEGKSAGHEFQNWGKFTFMAGEGSCMWLRVCHTRELDLDMVV
mmetsp:Transcript_11127/g.30420  ORF Transcript_11127/g.30420 Transcript_11127/m.30420 type:complete len:84 (+) Transcript_11127:659-910(+)